MKRLLIILLSLIASFWSRLTIGSHGIFLRLQRQYIGIQFAGQWWFRRLPVIAGGTDGVSSQGTYISFGDSASPNTFTEVGEMTSISGPTPDSEEIDMTHLRSVGGFREYLQSFKDSGEVSCEGNYLAGNATQDGATGVRSLFLSGAVRGWKITFPDASYVTFDAYVKSIGVNAAVGEKLGFNFTLRVTGAPTFNE